MKKKLSSYIILGLVALIAIAIMVMFIVPVSYMPTMSKPINITVYQTSNKYAAFNQEKTAENYNAILTAYNQSFQQNFLSALFAGQTTANSSQTSSGELKTTTSKPSYSTYIVLDYEAQKIVVNGHKQNVSVDQIILQVENTTTFANVKVYFKQGGSSSSETYYYMTTLAKQASLYEVITSLEIPE